MNTSNAPANTASGAIAGNAPGPYTYHPRSGRRRFVGPDVTRAVALIGVVIMNYHGFMDENFGHAVPGSSFMTRLFDPWTGVLSTRFAATFVFVAGVGVTLLTNRSRLARDRQAISADRWRLVRRGALLYGFGIIFDWVWAGTILPFYGAMFIVAALLFTLRARWIALVGVVATVSAVSIQWWAVPRIYAGNYPYWLFGPNTFSEHMPRGLLYDVFVNGTHPLLPWLAFLCAGMIIGRALPAVPYVRLALGGMALTAVCYAINHWVTPQMSSYRLSQAILSTQPFSRGLLYVLCTLGSSVAAFCIVSLVAERFASSFVVRVLQLAGQTSLTLYVGHAYFYKIADALGFVQPTGLGRSLTLALVYWVLAIVLAALWQFAFGIGPVEWFYRKFGG